MTSANWNSWAGSLSYSGSWGATSDWRLPTVTDIGSSGCSFAYAGTDFGYNVNTATGEMALSEMPARFLAAPCCTHPAARLPRTSGETTIAPLVWGGSSAGRASRSQCEGREFDPPPLHHYSAPNRSRLGVFVCEPPKPRGVPGHFACASRSAHGRHDRPGSPLFRPVFSRNLRQLLRHGTRRRRFSSMVCACADGNGWLAGLLFQIARANPRGQPPRQPLGGNGSSP